MFLMIPEASHAFKWMFFDALVIQKPSQIDPGSISEKSSFDLGHSANRIDREEVRSTLPVVIVPQI